MARAKMSTGAHRHYLVTPDEDGICDIFPGITETRTRDEKIALADSEARAILAETEPHGEMLWHYNGVQRLSADFCEVLAESLAAFILS